MQISDTNATKSPSPPSRSPSPTAATSPASPGDPTAVVSPCAACKILRRRCTENCVLAPYFPPTEPSKFAVAHRVFGASNIIKFLQDLPKEQRTDAVSSMVYEAEARIRDPVYGCAGAICQLQRQVDELQAELAKAQANAVKMQLQHANLLAQLLDHHHLRTSPKIGNFDDDDHRDNQNNNLGFLDDDNNPLWWDHLWI